MSSPVFSNYLNKELAVATTEKQFDSVQFIMDWENGSLSSEETAAGFQHLIDSGLAWRLQGCYGRAAKALIEAGYCVDTHRVLGGKK